MRPVNSAPGENGNSGLYWYFPAMISRSKKLSATASTRTTACPGPATGSGRSPMVRSVVRAAGAAAEQGFHGQRLQVLYGFSQTVAAGPTPLSQGLRQFILSIADFA